jgi:hypothetical protein
MISDIIEIMSRLKLHSAINDVICNNPDFVEDHAAMDIKDRKILLPDLVGLNIFGEDLVKVVFLHTTPDLSSIGFEPYKNGFPFLPEDDRDTQIPITDVFYAIYAGLEMPATAMVFQELEEMSDGDPFRNIMYLREQGRSIHVLDDAQCEKLITHLDELSSVLNP